MLVVIGLGGNALLERAERPEADIQEDHVRDAVAALAPIAHEHAVVITHGNGPQVGVLAAESEKDPSIRRPYPFDVLGAQTQGMIGYWLLQALENALPRMGVAAVLTQTVVDAGDPAFQDPQKFVGPLYDGATATRLSRTRGWEMRPDERGFRRVVASPEPQEIVELDEIRDLLRSGSVVVCAGGGGIPVVRRSGDQLQGVEAVVDKDLTAALLAERLGADRLVILTDVAAVELEHGTARARPIGRITADELRSYSFPAGSMGPKVEAACRFVTATGGVAAIGKLTDAAALVAGTAGTVVEPAGVASGRVAAAAGHRLLPHTADCMVEAWGPDRASCVTEALAGLVESFVEVPDAAATRTLPLAAAPGGAEDALVSLFEDVIYAVDVFGVVPVRFHLGETEDGGIAGDMEVVTSDQLDIVGPVPKGVSYHGLSAAPVEGSWRCRVLVDV